MAKVIFELNVEHNVKNIYDALASPCAAGHRWEIPQYLKRKVKGKDKGQIIRILKQEVPKMYQKNKKHIDSFMKKLEKEWRSIELYYFKIIERITGYKFKQKSFRCWPSLIERCPYYKKRNAFAVFHKDGIRLGKWVIAEEIYHMHFWHIWEDILKRKFSAKSWALNECSAFLVLNEKEFDNMLPRIKTSKWWYKDLRKYIPKLVQLYKRKNFKDFLISGLDIIKKPK